MRCPRISWCFAGHSEFPASWAVDDVLNRVIEAAMLPW
jgi:hypothetical protein